MSTDPESRAPGGSFLRASLPPLERACGCLRPWNEADEESIGDFTGDLVPYVANLHCATCGGSGRREHPRPSPTPARMRALALRPAITVAELIDRDDVARLARYGARWLAASKNGAR